MERDKNIIIVGDPNNAFIDEDDNCIVFKITRQIDEEGIDETKYKVINSEIKTYVDKEKK